MNPGAGAPNLPITGRCMCETVQIEVLSPLLGALYCHCKRCQRRTGSAFSVTAVAFPGSLRVSAGHELIRKWDPGDGGWIKSFCSVCGSQLFTEDPDDSERVRVRMGLLDEDPGVRPSVHQFVGSAAPWEPALNDRLPRYDEHAPAGWLDGGESCVGHT